MQETTMSDNAESSVKGEMTSNLFVRGRVNEYRWGAAYRAQLPLNLVFMFDK